MNNRQTLIDLANGKRPGYWVEVLHEATTGVEGYVLHRPNETGATPAPPCDLEALSILAAWNMDREGAAATLPRYDDGRTYKGGLINTTAARALTKWAKK